VKFWLLTLTRNQARKLAMLEDYFKEEEEGGGGSLSRNSHNKHWPAKSTHCCAVCVFSRPKKTHSVQVQQM